MENKKTALVYYQENKIDSKDEITKTLNELGYSVTAMPLKAAGDIDVNELPFIELHNKTTITFEGESNIRQGLANLVHGRVSAKSDRRSLIW